MTEGLDLEQAWCIQGMGLRSWLGVNISMVINNTIGSGGAWGVCRVPIPVCKWVRCTDVDNACTGQHLAWMSEQQ